MPIAIRLKKLKQFLIYVIPLPALLYVIPAWSENNEPLAQLRINYAAFAAAEEDFRAQREFATLNGKEAEDYAAYVARLQRRVFENCKEIMDAGVEAPEELPCPKLVSQETRSADIVIQAERTPEEQVAALDQMLIAGLGEYDERLLTEQERIKAAAPPSNSGGGGAGSEGGGPDGGGHDSQSNSGGDANENGEAKNGDDERQGGPGDSSKGPGDQGGDNDQPTDMPSGNDDDIVARQLREAAEKEADPELKAKLWEEYRRYKKDTG